MRLETVCGYVVSPRDPFPNESAKYIGKRTEGFRKHFTDCGLLYLVNPCREIFEIHADSEASLSSYKTYICIPIMHWGGGGEGGWNGWS